MWTIKTETGSNTYDAKKLVDLLIGKIMTSEQKDHELQLSTQFVDMMVEHLADTPPRVLLNTGLRLGYLYRLFMEKNNVSYETSDKSNVDNIAS